jgi:signal transduction histidine kinase
VHLQQVLLNLVSNGMDAIDEAGASARSVLVSARTDGTQGVEIAVSDTGAGIAAAAIGQVFEPFYTTKAKGMGMGLSISRTIIEAHGGKLWAESRHGRGACFLFTVPAA